MIHPHTEVRYINEEKGKGLFATQSIPKGTITWCFDPLDREISPNSLQQYPPQFRDIIETYSYRNNKGNFIFCWDNGRYINHSFHANCCLTPYNFELAIRDIEEGEEITDDYGYLNIIEPFAACDEGDERKMVYPDDLLHHWQIWDAQIQLTFPHIVAVEQALWNFLPLTTTQLIPKMVQQTYKIPSLKNCYCEDR